MEHVFVKIRRQDSPEDLPYWEEFEVPRVDGMTVAGLFEEIAMKPINADGLPSTPIVWSGSCLEEACGGCTAFINGKVRPICSTFVEELDQPIVIEPMKKFPVVRDLRV